MANEKARRLRKSMTPQEVKLWVHLRTWRGRGYHFRRQSPREGYIVDFVCMRHRLVIEIDGGQHNENFHAEDRKRDQNLNREGFKVLRFWNNEVDRNLSGVLEVIDRELSVYRTPPRRASRADPPPAGEG